MSGKNGKEIKHSGFELGMISRYRSEIFGITILWIMLLHGVIMDKVVVYDSVEWLYIILKHGNVGVDIFLFLSGIGLYYSFSKDSDLGHYMKKRLSRVLVPYLVIGGIYFLYKDIFCKHAILKFLTDLSLMSFVFKGNKLIWYIFGIMFCYIIFPYIYRLLYEEDGRYKKTMPRKFVLLLIGFVAFAFLLLAEYPTAFGHIEVAVTRIPVFVCGCAMAGIIKSGKRISYAWLILALLVVVTSYPIFVGQYITGIYQRYYYCILGISLVFVFTYIFALVRWKAMHRFFCWFGAISLELYLCHILMRDYLMHSRFYGGHVFLKYLILLLIAITIAKLVSVCISAVEKHLRG